MEPQQPEPQPPEPERGLARAAAIRNGLGVGLAVGISGLAFGAAAVVADLNIAQACALSLLAFTGASQFALVGVVAGGGNLIAGVAGAVLLGGRNALYGLRLTTILLRPRGVRRLLTAQGVIDETTAVATAQPDADSARAGFWATGISIFLTWNLTTLLGAVGATQLGDPETLGIDVVAPAAFLALLWPRLAAPAANRGGERRVAVLAVFIALAATPLLPVGVPVMLAASAALLGVWTASRRSEP